MSQTLTTAARAANQSIRQAVDLLAPLLRQKRLHRFSDAIYSYSHHQSVSVSFCPNPTVVAWDIVAMWLTGVVTKNLSVEATLSEAGEWFLGSDESEVMNELLPAKEVGKAQKALPSKLNAEVCHELLPYILDPHGPGSRLSVRRDPTTRAARVRKRADGVFYTPVDVAEFMVKGCLDSLNGDGPPTIYDPACGTGIFLRTALRELSQRHRDKGISSLAFDYIFGTDVAPWPLDASAFVLLADLLVRDSERDNLPIELWSRLRLNLRCIDTLLLEPVTTNGNGDDNSKRVSLSKLFSAMKRDPTVIVGNPPYANLGTPPHIEDLTRSFKTLQVKPVPTAEVYVTFLEQMMRLASRKKCAGSLVLPLSIASNIGPQFTVARQLIQETPGRWQFAFFDREPQALFGEDVKTRNAILFWNRDASSKDPILFSGPLRRWRRDNREAMFDSIRFTQIHCDIRSGVPKVEGSRQAAAIETLRARQNKLGQAVYSIKRMSLADAPTAGDDIVLVGTTAYNFLNVFLRPPSTMLVGSPQLSENHLHAIQCATPEIALAVYGILSSHFAYWWWHTYGDGFHVLRRFIMEFPFGNDVLLHSQHTEVLSKTGSTLWSAINTHPTISLNRGRVSIAYNPNHYTDARLSVDRLLVSVAGLDDCFVDELRRFVEHTVAATPLVGTDGNIDMRLTI